MVSSRQARTLLSHNRQPGHASPRPGCASATVDSPNAFWLPRQPGSCFQPANNPDRTSTASYPYQPPRQPELRRVHKNRKVKIQRTKTTVGTSREKEETRQGRWHLDLQSSNLHDEGDFTCCCHGFAWVVSPSLIFIGVFV